MSTDEGPKPWDAPDPSQIRITSSPSERRGPKDPKGKRRSKGTAPPGLGGPGLGGPSLPKAPVVRGPKAPADDPISAPVRSYPNRPVVPRPRVSPDSVSPDSPLASSGADAPAPPRIRATARAMVQAESRAPSPTEPRTDPRVEAPPIPRPRYPYGAPPPAVVDTRSPAAERVARVSVGPGADSWPDLDEPGEPTPDAQPQTVLPWAMNAGVGLGVGSLLLIGLLVGAVVGRAAFLAVLEAPPDSVEVAIEPRLRAFEGVDLGQRAGQRPAVPSTPSALVPLHPSADGERRGRSPNRELTPLTGRPEKDEPRGPIAPPIELPPQTVPEDLDLDRLEQDIEPADIDQIVPPVDEP